MKGPTPFPHLPAAHRLERRGLLPQALLLVLVVLGGLAAAAASPGTARADSTCADGVQASGAHYRICMPEKWNGKLVVFAHGFVDPRRPVGIPEEHLEIGGVKLADMANALGYAFAASSFSKNGLAILQGLDDMRDLVQVFTNLHGAPSRVYITGASEGGLITALAVERYPDVFHGGLSACGPIGSFRGQINYFGDVRVLFDYYFPGLLPGSPIDIPPSLVEDWEEVYEPKVIAALMTRPGALQDIEAAGRIARQSTLANRAAAVAGALWYNVHATMDAIQVLGGLPFDNSNRIYSGSSHDLKLNLGVARFKADAAALEAMKAYETSGKLSVPLVTLHNTGDPIVPYWHQLLYYAKATPGKRVDIPIVRGGHCNFTAFEALNAFLLLQVLAP